MQSFEDKNNNEQKFNEDIIKDKLTLRKNKFYKFILNKRIM